MPPSFVERLALRFIGLLCLAFAFALLGWNGYHQQGNIGIVTATVALVVGMVGTYCFDNAFARRLVVFCEERLAKYFPQPGQPGGRP